MVEYSASRHAYKNLSYEDTIKVIKEYFRHHDSSEINFEIFPLEDTDFDMDIPINNNNLEGKFLGS